MKQTKTMKALVLLLIVTVFSTSLIIGGCSSESTSRAESRAEETGPPKIQECSVLRPDRQFSFAYTWYRSTEGELLLTYNTTLDSLHITARTDNSHIVIQKVTLSATDAATGLTADFTWQLAGDDKAPDIYVTRSFKTLTTAGQPNPGSSAAPTGLRGSALLTMVALDCLGQPTLAQLLQSTQAADGQQTIGIRALGWTTTPATLLPQTSAQHGAEVFVWNGQMLVPAASSPAASHATDSTRVATAEQDKDQLEQYSPQEDERSSAAPVLVLAICSKAEKDVCDDPSQNADGGAGSAGGAYPPAKDSSSTDCGERNDISKGGGIYLLIPAQVLSDFLA